MGIIENLLKPTPFYKFYNKYKQEKVNLAHQKQEEELMPLRVEFYKNFINPGDTVFDVGANVGNRVEAFLQCEAKVIAVEPQPSCVEILTNKFGNRLTIENVGLNDTIGELEMQIANDSTVSSFNKDYINKTKERFKYSKWEKTIKVQVTTLDNLIIKHGVPKFCKIDVEGFELQVLKGLHTKIPFISIEYCVPEMENQNIECLKYLNSLDNEALYNYSIGESMKWALTDWMKFDEFMKHVESKDFTRTSFGDIYIKSSAEVL